MQETPPTGETPTLPKRRGAWPGIRALAVCAVACAVSVWLFSAGGPGAVISGLDFLTGPLVVFFIFRFIAKMSYLYLVPLQSSPWGDIITVVFRRLAFGVSGYLILNQSMNFTRFSFFTNSDRFFSELEAIAGYYSLIVTGFLLHSLGTILSRFRVWHLLMPVVKAGGQVLAGWALMKLVTAFDGYWTPLGDIGLVLFIGTLAAAAANIGAYGMKLNNPTIWDAAGWLQKSPKTKFLIGALIATYILFARPAIIDAFSYAPLIEWAIVCFVAWRLFSSIRGGLYRNCSVEIIDIGWQKHEQVIASQQGVDLPQLNGLQQDFIEEGKKDMLLSYLTRVLDDNNIIPDDTAGILLPLQEHRDVRLPWYCFGIGKRRRARKNRHTRITVLEHLVANLDALANPVFQKSEGVNQ